MELAEERAAVIEAGHRLAARGLVIGSSGNLSMRRDDRVVATPTGIEIDKMTPEDLCVLDLDGTWISGRLKPTSEVPLHLAVYRETGAGAIAHTHAVTSAAVSCTCTELPAIHYNCLQLGGPTRVAPYATYGTPQLAVNVVEALAGGRNAALMANHGSIAYGDTMSKACDRLELLEWLCEHYAASVALGEPRVLSKEELDDVIVSFLTDSYGSGPTEATP
ncbi:MAG TPA: class II aldolase/adducin family protein [Acidimicrobiales bacterium]|jgi:L-fuculose-phosphate aldolase